MKVTEVIDNIFIIDYDSYKDERGEFNAIWNRLEFKRLSGIKFNPIQLNQSISKKDVLRGMHFQDYPVSQNKLITIQQGSIIDVVVDIRKKSKDFGKIFMTKLDVKNPQAIFVTGGFAHGFLALEENTVVNYLVDEQYVFTHQGCINAFDKDLRIPWPIESHKVIVSERDLQGLEFKQFKGI